MSENGYIQFIANYPQWKCVKKFTITEKTGPKTFMEFLISYSLSLDNKLEQYLYEIVDMKEVDVFIQKAPAGKGIPVWETAHYLGQKELEETIQKVSRVSSDETLNKELASFIRVYATRKVLRASGLLVEPSQIEIPGLKRLLKKKKFRRLKPKREK